MMTAREGLEARSSSEPFASVLNGSKRLELRQAGLPHEKEFFVSVEGKAG
jgi:hypothetical protein